MERRNYTIIDDLKQDTKTMIYKKLKIYFVVIIDHGIYLVVIFEGKNHTFVYQMVQQNLIMFPYGSHK